MYQAVANYKKQVHSTFCPPLTQSSVQTRPGPCGPNITVQKQHHMFMLRNCKTRNTGTPTVTAIYNRNRTVICNRNECRDGETEKAAYCIMGIPLCPSL